MTRRILQSFGLLSIVAIIATSCSTTHQYKLVQRKQIPAQEEKTQIASVQEMNVISPVIEGKTILENQSLATITPIEKKEIFHSMKPFSVIKKVKEIKREIKSMNLNSESKNRMNTQVENHLQGDQLLSVIVAIFLPFVGVAIYEDGITSHFWIALLLTLLFYLPGLIYALVIILGD